MDLTEARRTWLEHGFVVLPAYLRPEDLKPAVAHLYQLFPTAEGYHDGTDPRSGRFVEDQFAGIDLFPFRSVEFSLLAVHDRLVRLAEALLDDQDIRISSAETWGKYTGAVDYEQDMHRDYLGHTLLVPSDDPRFRQAEIFVLLNDVPDELGTTHLISRTRTADVPGKPNWIPREDRPDRDPAGFDARRGRPRLYDSEVSGAGPAGTVIAWEIGTFHRGTNLRMPRGARFTMHINFRSARIDWGQRVGWATLAHDPGWYEFVHQATPRQLALFGFPPPGHPFWTSTTLTGIAQRYPHLDLTPWRTALGGQPVDLRSG